MNSGPSRKIQLNFKANSSTENEGQLFRPTPPSKNSCEPFCLILRPTLQLKIKANSSTEN